MIKKNNKGRTPNFYIKGRERAIVQPRARGTLVFRRLPHLFSFLPARLGSGSANALLSALGEVDDRSISSSRRNSRIPGLVSVQRRGRGIGPS